MHAFRPWTISLLKILLTSALLAAAYALGHHSADESNQVDATTFHDMHVISPSEMMELVDMTDPKVLDLARRVRTIEEAYRYVRDNIAYDPAVPLTTAAQTIAAGTASCLGKAALLASLYRALGMDDENVRIVTGQIFWNDKPIEHAWLEIEHQGRCLQQDPTTLFGRFDFDQFENTSYAQTYIQRETFCFNDNGFAIVSLRNRFRGRRDPHDQAATAIRP